MRPPPDLDKPRSGLNVSIIIIIIKMQDLEWHIIMSIIAGALYIIKSRVGYKRSFEHDSLELSTEVVEGRCSTK